MLKMQIDGLKEELNRLADNGLDSEQIYKLSVELDRLIVRYYKESTMEKKGETDVFC